jgi:hypothetical protein
MWLDELMQGFRTRERRQLTAWQGHYRVPLHYRYQRLGTFSFIGMVWTVAISCANKTSAVAAILTDWQFKPEVVLSKPVSLQRVEAVEAGNRWLLRPLIVQMPTPDLPESPDILPPANLPINQGGVVKVPPVKRPEAILPSTGTPTTPPATLPPTDFPTTQIPTLSVPTLESPSTQTPAPLNTSKPLEGSFRRISPAINPVPVIDFGQPLPKITPAKPMPKLQSFLPRL